MSYNNFQKTAQAIFDSFPNEQIWSQGGLKPNRQLKKPEAGYCVIIRYDEKVTGAISHFMAKVHSVLPHLVAYNEQNLHTTIGTYGKTDMKDFIPDPAIRHRLMASLGRGINDHSRNIRIEFGKWLYNEEAILIAGYPNQILWDLCQTIGNIFQENNLTFGMGRIFHITTARFTRNVSFQAFEEFCLIMKSAPVLEATKPVAIDLATWSCNGWKFKLVPHKRFVL